jgi:hypothetical protein
MPLTFLVLCSGPPCWSAPATVDPVWDACPPAADPSFDRVDLLQFERITGPHRRRLYPNPLLVKTTRSIMTTVASVVSAAIGAAVMATVVETRVVPTTPQSPTIPQTIACPPTQQPVDGGKRGAASRGIGIG